MRLERLTQRRLEPGVDLDDVNVPRAPGKVLGEHSQAASDLQHHVIAVERCGTLDHAEDVRVDEKVLTEVAVRPHAVLA
jgi:hypothetical protein